MKVTCKCHGLSGSCSLITCWQQLAPFRKVGKIWSLDICRFKTSFTQNLVSQVTISGRSILAPPGSSRQGRADSACTGGRRRSPRPTTWCSSRSRPTTATTTPPPAHWVRRQAFKIFFELKGIHIRSARFEDSFLAFKVLSSPTN